MWELDHASEKEKKKKIGPYHDKKSTPLFLKEHWQISNPKCFEKKKKKGNKEEKKVVIIHPML